VAPTSIIIIIERDRVSYTYAQPHYVFERAADSTLRGSESCLSSVTYVTLNNGQYKDRKYSSIIPSNYIFKGLAFETLAPCCKANKIITHTKNFY
jgi:hypothetical protein